MRLTEHRAKIVIEDQVARVEVVQVFHNPNPWQMEGIYLFPLPEGAAVADFTMSMGGKQITGEILDSNRAREIYRSIVRRRDDPGLLEYAGRRLIRARLFPIPPRGDTKVTLAYGQVLRPEGGLIELTYPMRSRAFGHGRVKMSAEIEVKDKAGVSNLLSPTHRLDVVQKDDGRWIASFEEASAAPERDLQILYALGNKEFGLSLSTHKPAGEDGYFVLLLSPRTSAKRVKVLPKDVVYVLDTSGSMGDRGGRKMKQAQRALNYALGRLRPGDRFNIVSFATEARPFREALVPASPENIKAAVEHVEGLVATGGTAIHDALVAALSMAEEKQRAAGRVPLVIFLTDGQPTIGPVEPKSILAAAARSNAAKARLFVFGVGYDVNTRLLGELADAHRGSGTYVTEKEDIEHKVSALVDQVSSPVLTDVSVKIDGIDVHDVYPRRIGDLFRGQQVVLVGRYKGKGAHAVRLTGRLGAETVEYVYEASFDGGARRKFLPQLWAVRRVGFLLGEVARNGAQKELVDEIRRLGIKYGIVTPYTSFLVVDERELARRRMRGTMPGVGGPPPSPEVRRRLESALRDLDEEAEAAAEAKDALDKGSVSGRGAVGGSKAAGKLKKAKSPSKLAGRGIKRIAGKTFRWRDGVWEDIDYTNKRFDGPLVEAAYLSDAYMKLLEDDALARLLSVGPNVTVLYKGTLYRVRKSKG
ncbi:MAG: VIT and vWA domain-containing protein [Planctomycetota bacterium]